MSRVLPARRNLEHLKKQAKDLLPDLQERTAGAKLADARHALARQYVFASWPKARGLRGVVGAVAGKPVRRPLDRQHRESDAASGRPVRSASLRFDVSGDRITIVDSLVFESGDEHQGTNTIQADGQEHSSGRPAYVLTASRPGLHAIEVVARKDGREEGSPDGALSYGNAMTAGSVCGI